jgi:hypothetical protein
MKIIKGDLEMKKDIIYNENLIVEGNIFGKNGKRYNLFIKGDINAFDINAGDINALDINARDINARDINAFDINARNINAMDINAFDINARDINARDINARNIIAEDINAGDINALDINAEDISYYAVAFAYKNIWCKSITGRRGNFIEPFVLDGKIKIFGDKCGKIPENNEDFKNKLKTAIDILKEIDRENEQ